VFSGLRAARNIIVATIAAIATAPATSQPVSPASHAASVPNVVNADCRPEPKINAPLRQ